MVVSDGEKFLLGLKPNLRVFISAGAAGIGRAIADTLVHHGAKVHICDISKEALDDFRKRHPEHGATLADVSKETDVAQAFQEMSSSLGGLDALINNAGIAGPTKPIEEISPDEWRRCVDVCLTGQFLCVRNAVPLLKDAGGGAIVNMSSTAGRLGYAYRTPYSAAKFGVVGFTQSLAKELGPHNIRVNAILPGAVEGDRIDRVIRDRARQFDVSETEMRERYLARISLRRMVTAHDVAAMVLYLLSPLGQNLSGQSIGVDGNVETL